MKLDLGVVPSAVTGDGDGGEVGGELDGDFCIIVAGGDIFGDVYLDFGRAYVEEWLKAHRINFDAFMKIGGDDIELAVKAVISLCRDSRVGRNRDVFLTVLLNELEQEEV